MLVVRQASLLLSLSLLIPSLPIPLSLSLPIYISHICDFASHSIRMSPSPIGNFTWANNSQQRHSHARNIIIILRAQLPHHLKRDKPGLPCLQNHQRVGRRLELERLVPEPLEHVLPPVLGEELGVVVHGNGPSLVVHGRGRVQQEPAVAAGRVRAVEGPVDLGVLQIRGEVALGPREALDHEVQLSLVLGGDGVTGVDDAAPCLSVSGFRQPLI